MTDLATPTELSVAESITGYYRYHLRRLRAGRAICGAPVMHTSIPLSAWGTKTHLNESWCRKCENEASADGESLPTEKTK